MEETVKARQIFLNVACFIPLVLFQIWISSYHTPGNTVIAAFAMLAYCILIIVSAYRWDRHLYMSLYSGIMPASYRHGALYISLCKKNRTARHLEKPALH